MILGLLLALALGSILTVGLFCRLYFLLDRIEKRCNALAESLKVTDSALDSVSGKVVDLNLAVDNMRATAGPLPPVILHRTRWEQDEMNLEMQPSEAAAIIARMDAQEQVQKVTEDRIQAIESRRDERQITAHITSTAIEIGRHMAANRADFETQLIRRVVYCEEHVDQANRRLDLVELSQFAKNAKVSKGKKKS